MAASQTILMVGEKKAAAMFDLTPADFLKGVQLGHFPKPRDLFGHRRWVFQELHAIATGQMARPDGGLEI